MLRTNRVGMWAIIVTVFTCMAATTAPAAAETPPITCAQQEWVQVYDGPAHGADLLAAMVTDNAGNVYAIGRVQGAGSDLADQVTLRYNADGTLAWSAFYNGPGQINGTNFDVGKAIAVDAAGSVYVTGVSTSATAADYLTIKYSSTGAVLWERRYNGTTTYSSNPHDEPADIAATDSAVIVAGISTTNTGALQMTTLLYDRDGNLLRELRRDAESVRDVQVDANGNIYVLGSATVGSTGTDILLVKYAADGTYQWERTYGLSDADAGVGLVTDAAGSVYVAGNLQKYDQYAYKEPVILKYAGDGTLQWAKPYGATVDDQAEAIGIAIGGDGNPTVAGNAASGGAHPTVILHYSADGTLLWKQLLKQEDTYAATAVAVDGDDNVYVTAWAGYPMANIATAKYSAGGVLRSLAHYYADGGAQPTAIAAAGDGRVFVGGAGNGDITIVKYGEVNPATATFAHVSGSVVGEGDALYQSTASFQVTLSHPAAADLRLYYHILNDAMEPIGGYPLHDEPLDIYTGQASATIAVPVPAPDTDPDGTKQLHLYLQCSPQVFVTNPQIDATIVDDDQPIDTLAWQTSVPQAGTVVGLNIDAAGSVVLGTSAGLTVHKFNTDGALLWSRSQPGFTAQTQVDTQGNILLTGGQQGPRTQDIAIQKYGPDGALLWSRLLDGAAGVDDRGNAVASDVQGNVYVTGQIGLAQVPGQLPLTNLAVAALTANGDLRWLQTKTSSAGQWSSGTKLAVDGAGNAVVGGSFIGAGEGVYAALTKYAPDGGMVWHTKTETGMALEDLLVGRGNSLTALHMGKYPNPVSGYASDGNRLWRTTCMTGQCVYADIALDGGGNILVAANGLGLTKLSPAGQFVWSGWGSGMGIGSSGRAAAADAAGNAFVTGQANGKVMTLAYTASGIRRWQQVLGSGSGAQLAVDAEGSVLVAGEAGSSVVLAKYDPAPQLPLITVNDPFVVEREGGTTQVVFVVQLSAPSDHPLTIAYATVSGTAVAGVDFDDAAGTVTIPAHATQAAIPITILIDSAAEAGESFYLNLGGGKDLYFADVQGRAVIFDQGAHLLYMAMIER